MEVVFFLINGVFALLGLICLISVASGRPGARYMLLLAVAVEWGDRFYLAEGEQTTFGWTAVMVCAVMAVIGKFLHYAAMILNPWRRGFSIRGKAGALIVGLVGALMGSAIPGPFAGAIMGVLAGTFCGGVVGEFSHGETNLPAARRPHIGMIMDRVLSSMQQLFLAIAAWVILVTTAFTRQARGGASETGAWPV